MAAPWRDRKRVRHKPYDHLCEELGSKLLLFRFSADNYQDRLLIISHGCHDLQATPQTFDAHGVEFRFLAEYGEKGDLKTAFSAIEKGSYRKEPKNTEKDQIRNYTLSKTQGYHAGVNGDELFHTYAGYQDAQATMNAIDEERLAAADEVLSDPYAKDEHVKMANEIKDEGRRVPYDILTVRSRFWDKRVSLQDAFTMARGRHNYQVIYCVFCRVIYSNGQQVPPGFNF